MENITEPKIYKTYKQTARLRPTVLPWMFMAPSICLLLFVVGAPMAGTFILSLTDWNGLSQLNYIGLANFNELFRDKIFYAALFNNLKWLLIFLTIPVFLGLTAALCISRIQRGKLFYRSVLFVPYILSTVVTAIIWALIYNPFNGINVVLEQYGLGFLALRWLGDPKIALYSVAFADLWHFWGFVVVIFLVGLQQTDKSLEEAGKVEGAGRLQIFWYIILPQLRPTIVMVYMLLIIWSFAAFDYVFVMTQGGPGNATELLATYMYDLAIYKRSPGYASSVAVVLGMFTVIVIIGFGYLRRKGWDV